MDIYVYRFDPIDSRMYVLLEQNNALVIDPCIAHKAFEILEEKSVNKVDIILTHEHYDHISGVNEFKKRYSCCVMCSERCAVNIQNSKMNLSKYYDVLLLNKQCTEKRKTNSYECFADWTFRDKAIWYWKEHEIVLRETPGHSLGSICIEVDSKYLFTGDSLLKDTAVITKLPGGNIKKYDMFTKPYLASKHNVYVYPGHGESGWIEEFNIF